MRFDQHDGLQYRDARSGLLQWEIIGLRHEQRAPARVFSVAALSHVQLRADCLPHEPVTVGNVSEGRYKRKRLTLLTFGLGCADAALA